MELNNAFDDYEKNVIDILNNGFKALIDSLNETLNLLFQSTLIGVAENVENGIKNEFQTLVGIISDEVNVINNNSKPEKEKSSKADDACYSQDNDDFMDTTTKNSASYIYPDPYSDYENGVANDIESLAEQAALENNAYDLSQGIYGWNRAPVSRTYSSNDQNKGKYFDGKTGKFVEAPENNAQEKEVSEKDSNTKTPSSEQNNNASVSVKEDQIVRSAYFTDPNKGKTFEKLENLLIVAPRN